MDGPIAADACVVGLGGSGLAAVEDLISRGLSVVGIDAGRVAAGAAGRNGGILSGGGAMSKSHDHVVPQSLRFELYRKTMEELDRLTAELGQEVIRRVGTLRLAGLPGEPIDELEETSRARDLQYLTEEAEVLRTWGVAIEDYDGELGQGFYNPDTAGMNPVHRAFGLTSRLATRARLFEHTRATAVHTGGVETERGRIDAPIVIVAMDGKLAQLLPQFASLTRTVRLQMLATAPIVRRRLSCPTSFRRGYEWAQQDTTGRLFVGGGRDRFVEDEYTTDEEPTTPVQQWIESVAARLAAQSVTVTHRWAASVTYTEDQRATVILVEDGVVACGGYSGSGNLVGPVAARAAVALAVNGTTPPAYFRSSL
jgi:glycine/D-amino acid oxidase-like deaminating enzyme